MSPSALDRIADRFEQLRRLDATERDRVLEELELDDADRTLLARLLEADSDDRDPFAAAVLASARASDHPDVIGPWRLVSAIGCGGMGSVHLAERADGTYRQKVALKLLRGFPDQDSLRRFRQERQILASLDHPNIARLIDGGETEQGQPWLAMEHVDGECLLDYVARTEPNLDARLALFDAMLAAVEHAHQRLVVHRDLKPANVMVTREGVVKLLDFGIARLIDELADDTTTSTRVYSPGYASPEQRDGRSIATTSDIYSLGILLDELVSGRRAARHGEGRPNPLRPPDQQLASVIAKASAELPHERYPSIGAFRDDLRRYRNGRPVLATEATLACRLRKFVSRHRVASAATLLATVTLLLGVWRLSSERDRALAAEARASHALASSERDRASASAALDFLVETFAAAAPERALSQQVSVRDLLDQARRRLDGNFQDHPQMLQPLQRLLGHLYLQMGIGDVATELFERGLRGVAADSAATASRLASDYEEQADALMQMERLDDAAESLRRARALREQWLPDDPLERARSLDGDASLLHRRGDNPAAIALWRQALEAVDPDDPAMADVAIDIWQSMAGALGNHGEFDEALTASHAALALADRHLPAQSPERVPLLRAKGNALIGQGQPAEAEAVLRSAIALQEQAVGGSGVRMGTLYNDLGIALNALDRYSEAVAALEKSRELGRVAKPDGIEDTATLSNIASVYENAGDYERALQLSNRAVAQIRRSELDDGSIQKRIAERQHARMLMVVGRTDDAHALATRLREQSRDLEGVDSYEYAMLTWILTQTERRRANPDAGLPLLDESIRLFAALVPEGHPIYAQAHRVRAAFAMQRKDHAIAERELSAAIDAFSRLQADLDLAISRSELATLRRQQRRNDDARRLLEQALPVLRRAVLPTEIHRAAAERLARQIGM